MEYENETCPIDIAPDWIDAFCRKWKVKELSLFGSVLRDDFHAGSDLDVLVEFEPDAGWGWEAFDMEDQLREMFGRKVDVVFKGGLRNPVRRREILNHRQVLYAA